MVLNGPFSSRYTEHKSHRYVGLMTVPFLRFCASVLEWEGGRNAAFNLDDRARKIPIEFLITSAREKNCTCRSIAITIVKCGLQFEDTTNVIEKEAKKKKKKKILDVYARVYSISDLRNKLFFDTICIFK